MVFAFGRQPGGVREYGRNIKKKQAETAIAAIRAFHLALWLHQNGWPSRPFLSGATAIGFVADRPSQEEKDA